MNLKGQLKGQIFEVQFCGVDCCKSPYILASLKTFRGTQMVFANGFDFVKYFMQSEMMGHTLYEVCHSEDDETIKKSLELSNADRIEGDDYSVCILSCLSIHVIFM